MRASVRVWVLWIICFYFTLSSPFFSPFLSSLHFPLLLSRLPLQFIPFCFLAPLHVPSTPSFPLPPLTSLSPSHFLSSLLISLQFLPRSLFANPTFFPSSFLRSSLPHCLLKSSLSAPGGGSKEPKDIF